MSAKKKSQSVKLTFSDSEFFHVATSSEAYGIRLATFVRLVFWRGLDVVNRQGLGNPLASQTAMPLNGKDKKDAP